MIFHKQHLYRHITRRIPEYDSLAETTLKGKSSLMALVDSGNLMIWQALKLYLPVGTKLTSCRRPASEQLNFIKCTAEKHGYKFDVEPTLENASSWSAALDFIRSKGYKVAAPGRSMHQRGLAYDLSGPDLQKIAKAVRKAVADRRIYLVAGSRNNLLIEEKNHCVHVEISGAVLDFEPFEVA